MPKFYAGQKVDYYRIYAGARSSQQHLADWITGYVVVSPISPYNKSCVLIEKINPTSIDGPMNVSPNDLRPT